MREILKTLMVVNELTAHDLQRLSGVSAPTTYRFLTGRHADPKSDTVRRWAKVLGVTEGQLRGTEPIKGLSTESPEEREIALESVLTRDEIAAVESMRGLGKDARQAWLRIGQELLQTVPKDNHSPGLSRGRMRELKSNGASYKNAQGALQVERRKA